MKRGKTGVFETTTFSGETVQAFVPDRLPPDPPLDLAVLNAPWRKPHWRWAVWTAYPRCCPERICSFTPTFAKKPCSPPKSRGRNPRCPIFCCSSWRERRARPSTMSSKSRTTWRRSNMAWRGCGMIFRSRLASSVKSTTRLARAGPWKQQGPGRIQALTELDRREPARHGALRTPAS